MSPEPPGQGDSRGEAVGKEGNRGTGSLLRPCGCLGQNSKPGRLRAGPHHAHGQQFPFMLALPEEPGQPLHSHFSWEHHAEGHRIPSKTLSHCPLDPRGQGQEAALGHDSKLPSAVQGFAKLGTGQVLCLQIARKIIMTPVNCQKITPLLWL